MADEVFVQFRRTQIAEMADWSPDFDMSRVSVSASDREAGSPKLGDKIARNPKNNDDQWLVAAQYFADNFEPIAAMKGEAVPDAFERRQLYNPHAQWEPCSRHEATDHWDKKSGYEYRALYTHPAPDATRREAMEYAAKIVEPKYARPCDCDQCDCLNTDEAERVARWDEATASAAAIRAASEGGR